MADRNYQGQQLFIHGTELLRNGDSAQALSCFQDALEIFPSNATLYLYAGTALHDLGRFEDAIVMYRIALSIAPGTGEIHNNLGNSQMALGLFAEATESLAQASLLLPESPVPPAARATALQAIGNVIEAEIECRKAMAVDPDFAAAHWNLALNLLLQGRYAEGWQEYEWRWHKPDFTSPPRHTDVPLWDGSPLHGRTIVLHAEQGFGDAIQFVRYARLVSSCGGNVLLECHPQLVSLFQGIHGVKSVRAFDEEFPAFDCQAPFLTLPRILGTTLDSIPACLSLSVPVERLSKWQQCTARYSGPKVGLVWAGSSIHRNDRFRSIPLRFLSTFARLTDITFFSLQLGAAQCQLVQSPLAKTVIDLTDQIHDFADTAALIEQLDLVISIDSAVAHLAASLGKPVYLMLPFAPDWRWLLERTDSPWYPTMHIFRQKHSGDWSDVIGRVHAALAVLEYKKSFEVYPKDSVS